MELQQERDEGCSFFVSFRLKPTIRSRSIVNDVQRCTTKTADLTGDFNVTEARLTVEAFGISIWFVQRECFVSYSGISSN